MDLRVTGAAEDVTVPAGTTAVIGADSSATIKVARPGISRRHAVVKYDGSHWVVQDASSRNGTFHNGARIQFLDVKGPTTIRLGHPAEGTEIVLTPVTTASNTATDSKSPTTPASTPPPASAQRTRVAPATQATVPGNTDPRLDDLIASLNDTVKSIKGLTWSVWAMIAVTAVLALLTLFVGIVGN
ncbi:MAG: FHA domain-containing protein [Actinomycetia bacterium]|nr:FHA domain-containing protein [Actinomycetes bacterium]